MFFLLTLRPTSITGKEQHLVSTVSVTGPTASLLSVKFLTKTQHIGKLVILLTVKVKLCHKKPMVSTKII